MHKKNLMEVPVQNEMQRLPEKSFDLSKVDSCYVRDKYGEQYSLKEIRKNHTSIIIFVRVSSIAYEQPKV